MHSGFLLMLAPGGVDTSSQLSLSLPATVESARVHGATGRTWAREEEMEQDCRNIPRPASQPVIQSAQITDGAIISALAKPGA